MLKRLLNLMRSTFLVHCTQAFEHMQKLTKKNMSIHDTRHFLRVNRSSLLNQNMSGTQAECNEWPAKLAQHILRRARTGVGWRNKAVAHQKLALACEWVSSGFDS